MNHNKINSLPIRDAIRVALRKASFAKDTGNKVLYQEIRHWLKSNIRHRNTNRYVYY